MKKYRLLLVLPLVAWMSMGVSCNKYHDATVVEHNFTIALQAFQQSRMALLQQGEISAAENVQLQGYEKKILLADQAAVTAMNSSAAATTAQAQVQIVVDTITDLQTNGLTGLKNPTSVQILKTALLAADAIAQNFLTALKAGKA